MEQCTSTRWQQHVQQYWVSDDPGGITSGPKYWDVLVLGGMMISYHATSLVDKHAVDACIHRDGLVRIITHTEHHVGCEHHPTTVHARRSMLLG